MQLASAPPWLSKGRPYREHAALLASACPQNPFCSLLQSLTAALVCIQESKVPQQAAQAALEELVILQAGRGRAGHHGA